MKTLESYIDFSTKGRFAYYLKQAEKHEISLVNPEGYTHQACHLIKKHLFARSMREKLSLFQCELEINDIMPKISAKENMEEEFSDLFCGRYNYRYNKFEYLDYFLSSAIKEGMDKNKIIFIILDIIDYGVEPLNKKNAYVAHSVILLFIPEGKKYNCYYINSHGKDMVNAYTFEIIVSNRRTKKFNYSCPAEIRFIESYVAFLNKTESEDSKAIIPIQFDRTPQHIYYGVDLQAGDNHGVCFAYPFIIWYYFGKYYNTKRVFETEWGKVEIKKGSSLIKEGHLGLFIESMFIDFCPHFKRSIFEQMTTKSLRKSNIDTLQTIIEKRDILFTKAIVKSFVKFILQPDIKKKVKLYVYGEI